MHRHLGVVEMRTNGDQRTTGTTNPPRETPTAVAVEMITAIVTRTHTEETSPLPICSIRTVTKTNENVSRTIRGRTGRAGPQLGKSQTGISAGADGRPKTTIVQAVEMTEGEVTTTTTTASRTLIGRAKAKSSSRRSGGETTAGLRGVATTTTKSRRIRYH